MKFQKQINRFKRESQRAFKKLPKKPQRFLILVSAYHPLEKGRLPNEIYKADLDIAIDRFLQAPNKSFIVLVGGLHLHPKRDKISLWQSGRDYLLKKNIPEKSIFSPESVSKNKKFKDGQKMNEGAFDTSQEVELGKYFYKRRKDWFYIACDLARWPRNYILSVRNGIYPKPLLANIDNNQEYIASQYFGLISNLSNPDTLDRHSVLIRKKRKFNGQNTS